MGTVERVLNAISNPNVAYVLMLLGMMGLYFELANPGVILPGAIGGISLILAFFAFQALPVNYAGILLILLGLILKAGLLNLDDDLRRALRARLRILRVEMLEAHLAANELFVDDVESGQSSRIVRLLVIEV
jgi:hypothetical protein